MRPSGGAVRGGARRSRSSKVARVRSAKCSNSPNYLLDFCKMLVAQVKEKILVNEAEIYFLCKKIRFDKPNCATPRLPMPHRQFAKLLLLVAS